MPRFLYFALLCLGLAQVAKATQPMPLAQKAYVCPFGAFTWPERAARLTKLFASRPRAALVLRAADPGTDLTGFTTNQLAEIIERTYGLQSKEVGWSSVDAAFIFSQMELLREKIKAHFATFTPQQVREALRGRLQNALFVDWVLDLNEQALNDTENKAHFGQHFGEEKVWLGTGHSFFSTAYDSFSQYATALAIPPGGKVVDLGAGPLKAAPFFALERPDVSLVVVADLDE